jgi:hypothetical protein
MDQSMAHGWASTCKRAEDRALLQSKSYSPASTVMRHAFVLASASDGTRAGNENLKKLLC